MRGSLDSPPIVLRVQRGRGAVLVLGSAVFVAIGAGLWSSNGSSTTGALTVGFFGLCGLVGLAMAIAPPRLEIGPGGLVQTALWRTTRLAWADVYNFRPITIGLTNKAVGFDYLNPPGKRSALRGLNTALAGSQGSLQPGWEIDSQALSELLNKARERWLAASASTSQATAAPSPSPSVIGALGGSRINRKTYWIVTVVVFAISIALGYAGFEKAQRAIAPMVTIVFIRIFASRLHDFGRSGWWQLVLYGIQIPAIILIATAGGEPIEVATGLGVLIQVAFTVVLGAIPGDRGDNRFGPPPGAHTPVAASEVFR